MAAFLTAVLCFSSSVLCALCIYFNYWSEYERMGFSSFRGLWQCCHRLAGDTARPICKNRFGKLAAKWLGYRWGGAYWDDLDALGQTELENWEIAVLAWICASTLFGLLGLVTLTLHALCCSCCWEPCRCGGGGARLCCCTCSCDQRRGGRGADSADSAATGRPTMGQPILAYSDGNNNDRRRPANDQCQPGTSRQVSACPSPSPNPAVNFDIPPLALDTAEAPVAVKGDSCACAYMAAGLCSALAALCAAVGAGIYAGYTLAGHNLVPVRYKAHIGSYILARPDQLRYGLSWMFYAALAAAVGFLATGILLVAEWCGGSKTSRRGGGDGDGAQLLTGGRRQRNGLVVVS